MTILPRDSEHWLVVYSSFVYSLLGIVLMGQQSDESIGVAFFFVGCAAFFHHVFPKNRLCMIADWSGALMLIVLIGMNNITLYSMSLFGVALVVWMASIYHFHVTRTLMLYTIYHSLWHVLSAGIAYVILT